MTISPNTILSRKENFYASVIDGELLVLNEDTDCSRLCDVGADIWDHLAQTKTFAQLLQEIMSEYAVTREVCEPDLTSFIHQLQEKGLIDVNAPG